MDLAFVTETVLAHELGNDIDVLEVVNNAFKEDETSALRRYELRVRRRSGRRTTMKFVVKSNPDDRLHRLMYTEYSLMEKEISVYKEVLQPLEIIIDQHQDKLQKVWCDMIGSRDDILILEDLKHSNYKDLDDALSKNQTLISLQVLGRFHALTKILVAKGGLDVSKFRYNAIFQDEKLLGMLSSGGIITLVDVMRRHWTPDWKAVADRLEKSLETFNERMQEMHVVKEESMNVLNHGDMWFGNIMFRHHDYDDDEPIHAKLVDFQSCHYNSLAWDLTFFLYSSVMPTLRREKYENFLLTYYQAFKSTLEYYKYDGPLPTFCSIENEMKRFRYLAVVVLSTEYPSNLSGKPIDLKPFEQPKGPYLCFNPLIFQQSKFKSNIKEDFDYFISENVI